MKRKEKKIDVSNKIYLEINEKKIEKNRRRNDSYIVRHNTNFVAKKKMIFFSQLMKTHCIRISLFRLSENFLDQSPREQI